MTDVAGELLELLRGRQLPEQQQVRDLHEGALRRQLLHRIAAVQQHALIAVDVRDLALGRGGDPEAGIEGEHTQIFVERGDVDDGGTDAAAADGQLRLAIAGSIGELELFLGHAVRGFR